MVVCSIRIVRVTTSRFGRLDIVIANADAVSVFDKRGHWHIDALPLCD